MAWVTAEVWSWEIVNLKLLGGKVLLGERKGWTVGRNMDWRVDFLDLGPGGVVTLGKEGWEGRREDARYWEHKRERWFYCFTVLQPEIHIFY